MKLKYLLTSMVTSAALLLASCSVYHPQAVDIPLINHQGDGRVDLSVGASTFLFFPDVLTINATGSYGINDWLAGQVHLNYGGENIYAQIAPGAYFNLGAKSVFETYAGLGVGGAWRDNAKVTSSGDSDTVGSSSHTYSYSGSYLLPFVQFNIGFHDLTKAHIDLAFGLKTGAFMPDYTYNRYDSDGVQMSEYFTHYTLPSLLLEPQLQFRIGGEHVKYNLRVGVAYLSDMQNNATKHFNYDFITLSTGLTFTF
ncbi:MAG: hypothetical protein IJ761_03345 [Bacteroidales bacterium]|nr:hypothetical protein [Bacteroidales bacterium]